MNKNIRFFSMIYLILIFIPIKSSDLDPYLTIINSDSNQIAAALSRATDAAYNQKILNGTAPLDREFQIALISGRYDYLRTMPNKKNWLSNIFKSKKTLYINDFINLEIDPNTQDHPLQLAVKIAGYHKSQALLANEKHNIAAYNESIFKLHQMQQTILFLIESGANLDTQNRKGKTALHLAYENAEFQTVRILLNAHANPMIEDNLGKKPFRYLDKSKTKNEQEYNKLKRDYYESYNTWDNKIIKESNQTLSKIKIVPSSQEFAIDSNIQQKRIVENSSPTDTASSTTSSDRTSSERSSNRSTQQTKKRLPQSIELSSQGNLAPLQLKPRPATAGSLGISFKPAAAQIAPQDTLIIDTFEFNQHIKETKVTMKPTANNSKPLPNKPTEYFGPSYARGPAQAYMTESIKPKTSSSTAKKSTSKVYA